MRERWQEILFLFFYLYPATDECDLSPLQTVNVVVTKIDPQPTIDGGILIMVIGQLKVDADQPHAFSQLFHLKSMADNAFVVINDMFRLNVHNF